MNPKELCTREKNCAQGKINQLDARNGCSKKWLHERQRDHCWCTSDDLEIFRELELFKEARNPRMDWDLQSENNSRNLDIQLLHEKLPRELSWSESERELASAREISHESSFSLKNRGKTSSYYSKFQSLASPSGKAAVGSEKREPWAQEPAAVARKSKKYLF